MKICMGDKKADDTEPNAIEAHYGYPFIVQANRTLVCDVDDEMAKVAKMDIKLGRIMTYDKYMAMKKVATDEAEAEADAAETFEKYIEPKEAEPEPEPAPKPKPKPKGRPPAKPAAKKVPDKEPEKDPEPDKKE